MNQKNSFKRLNEEFHKFKILSGNEILKLKKENKKILMNIETLKDKLTGYESEFAHSELNQSINQVNYEICLSKNFFVRFRNKLTLIKT